MTDTALGARQVIDGKPPVAFLAAVGWIKAWDYTITQVLFIISNNMAAAWGLICMKTFLILGLPIF